MAIPPPEPRCPQCGAPVPIPEEDLLSACPFCGTHLFVDASKAVRHLIVEATLDAGTSAAALARWLKSREVLGSPRVTSSELVYFPMWEIESGQRRRLVPAAGALYEGLERIKVPAGDLKSFGLERARGPRGGPARVVEAVVPLESVPGRPGDGPRDGAAARLIHVPLVLILYEFHGVHYRAAVDGASGEVYPITVPRSAEKRIDAAFAALLTGALAANLVALALFKSRPLLSVVLLAGVAILFRGLGMRMARWVES